MENDRIWILLTRKLSGEATSSELRELDSLLKSQPGSEKLVAAVSDSWTAGSPTDADFLEATYIQHLERMKARGIAIGDTNQLEDGFAIYQEVKKKKPKGRELLLSALVIMLAAASFFVIKKPQESPVLAKSQEIGIVSTNNGARTRLLLPDGSGVWLNAGSSLRYNKRFDGKIREVSLTGEAFFDVVKDIERPFIIHTSKMDVKVLGTRFNVKAYEQDKTFETSIINGSVEVRLKKAPLEKYTLKPNQKLVLSSVDQQETGLTNKSETKQVEDKVEVKNLTYLPGTNEDIESSWTRNILSFEDEPFSEVCKKMERWYDVKFEFKNKRWENEFLHGSFEKESLEQAMNALKFTSGFNFSIRDKIISIY
jgi:ferric-dicitrate binding protein FerR (iron transport regulator)